MLPPNLHLCVSPSFPNVECHFATCDADEEDALGRVRTTQDIIKTPDCPVDDVDEAALAEERERERVQQEMNEAEKRRFAKKEKEQERERERLKEWERERDEERGGKKKKPRSFGLVARGRKGVVEGDEGREDEASEVESDQDEEDEDDVDDDEHNNDGDKSSVCIVM